jgi:capsular polysaccharide biosynthesis protein
MDLVTLLRYSKKNIKLIVIVVLCCAVISGSFKIITDFSAYLSAKGSIPGYEAQIESVKNRIDGVKSQISELESNYIYDSLHDIDTDNLYRYTASYYVDKNILIYSAAVNDMKLLKDQAQLLEIDTQVEVLDLFIDFTADTGSKIITISVWAPSGSLLDTYTTLAQNCFDQAYADITESFGTSSRILLSTRNTIGSNSTLLALKKQYDTQYTTLNASLASLETEYSTASAELAKIGYTAVSKETVEYILLGFILGIFISYIIILCNYYLGVKLIGIEQIVPRLNLLASGKDIKKISDASIVPIIYTCGKTTDPVGIVSSENLPQCKEIYENLKKSCDYDFRQLSNVFTEPDIAQTLLTCKGIILIEKYRHSYISKIKKLTDICQKNNILVYGVIIIE